MRVKTVATIGPASESPEVISQLVDAGLDVARINFSHATPEEAIARTNHIRAIAKDKQKRVAMLQDLCGRRIRIGELPGGSIELRDGQTVTFYTIGAPDISSDEIPINDPYLHQDVVEGKVILVESGRFRFTVTGVDLLRHRITAKVEKGGRLIQKKGVNVPYVRLTTPAITEKDQRDLALNDQLNFEFVALSFVQTPEDVAALRTFLKPEQQIISKVEDPIGVQNIDQIIAVSDGIMVARGDLGVELPIEDIPFIQKEIVAKCRFANKASIVATQMLLSMVHHPTPTRAEVSDIANAVIDGTDAVMLSDETAAGDYPVEAFKTLVKVANKAETFLYQPKNNLEF